MSGQRICTKTVRARRQPTLGAQLFSIAALLFLQACKRNSQPTGSPSCNAVAKKGQKVSMIGHRCIVDRPAQFAGEAGVILDDNYDGHGMLHVKFIRITASAIFHKDEVRILPVMA